MRWIFIFYLIISLLPIYAMQETPLEHLDRLIIDIRGFKGDVYFSDEFLGYNSFFKFGNMNNYAAILKTGH